MKLGCLVQEVRLDCEGRTFRYTHVSGSCIRGSVCLEIRASGFEACPNLRVGVRFHRGSQTQPSFKGVGLSCLRRSVVKSQAFQKRLKKPIGSFANCASLGTPDRHWFRP